MTARPSANLHDGSSRVTSVTYPLVTFQFYNLTIVTRLPKIAPDETLVEYVWRVVKPMVPAKRKPQRSESVPLAVQKSA